MIGKAKTPLAFKNFNLNALLATYYAQKSAWLSQDIFSDWSHKVFVPQVRAHLAEMQLPQETLVLMDNAPAHPTCRIKSDDGKITTNPAYGPGHNRKHETSL